MKEIEENIRHIEERLRYGNLSYKILESHRRLFELQNNLIISQNIRPFDEIAIHRTHEELAAYRDTYYGAYDEINLINLINSEKENLKKLYLLRNRPDSKMLDSQNGLYSKFKGNL